MPKSTRAMGRRLGSAARKMSSLFIALLLVTGFSPSWAGSMAESEIEGAGGANGTGKQPLYHTGGAGDRPLSGTGVGPLPQRDDPDDGTQGVRQLEYGDGNIAASVDFGQDVRLPAGAQLRVTPMGEGSDLDAVWAAVAVQLSDMLGLHDEGIASAYAFYDVSIVSEDGAYLTIDVPATVVLEPRVPLFADVDGSETVAMVHVGDGGTAELLEKDVAFSQDGRVGSVAVTTDTGLSSFGFVLVRDTGAPSSDEGRQAGTQEQESPAPAADGGPHLRLTTSTRVQFPKGPHPRSRMDPHLLATGTWRRRMTMGLSWPMMVQRRGTKVSWGAPAMARV